MNINLYEPIIAIWNETAGWCAAAHYIRSCVTKALESDLPVLECGSGLTTLLLGTIAKQSVWALEHNREWWSNTSSYLKRHEAEAARVLYAPIKSYDGFDWYEPPIAEMPRAYGLVVCDGPPGAETRGGRYGLLPVMGEFIRGAWVLMDDADRERELATAKRWKEEWGLSFHVEAVDSGRPYIVFRMPTS